MPWKKIVCAVMMYVPSVALANNKEKEDKKPIAENTGKTNVSPAANEIIPKPIAKVVAANATMAKAEKPAENTVALNTPAPLHKLTNRSTLGKGDMYVPLAGEIAYFGKNNDYVLNYVKSYYSKNVRHFQSMKGKSPRYFKIINKSFDKRGVPQELKYLSVIESALNNNAVSPVGAVGPWQFMAPTGQFMGLTVNEKIDERRDWGKSTNAAAKYLNYLYDQLQDWLLVVAAYNSGPRPVLNAIRKTGKSDFFAIKKYLPAETQNHVMAFIATATVMERMENYIGGDVPAGFNWKHLNIVPEKGMAAADSKEEAPPKNPLLLRFTEDELKAMAIVSIKKPIDLDVLSETLKIDRKQLGRWNYDFYSFVDDYNAGVKADFKLRLPKDKLESFLQKKDYLERQRINLDSY